MEFNQLVLIFRWKITLKRLIYKLSDTIFNILKPEKFNYPKCIFS
jgi:hypothetical protein